MDEFKLAVNEMDYLSISGSQTPCQSFMISDTTKPDPSGNPGHSGPPTSAEFKAMFTELLDDAKKDILALKLKTLLIKPISTSKLLKLSLRVLKPAQRIAQILGWKAKLMSSFSQKNLTLAKVQAMIRLNHLHASSVLEKKTSPAINTNLADIVKSVPAEKLSEVQGKYPRTEKCLSLVAPKISKLISGLYVVLQVCNSSSGDHKNALTHAAVLLLSAYRDLNLKCRDLIHPDLNKQYVSLCNLFTAVSTFLFGLTLTRRWKSLPYLTCSAIK